MSSGSSWHAVKALRAACSHENISSSMTGGGCSGPLASPPPRITTSPDPPFPRRATPRRSRNRDDATTTAAPPSARRAHSRSPTEGATCGARSTSASVLGDLVSAPGCRAAQRLINTDTMASCSRVVPKRSMW